MAIKYKTARGRYANVIPLALVASAARTTSGTSAVVEVADRGDARLLLDVTAVSGTRPSLSVVIETSYDNVTFRRVGEFTQQIATGQRRQSFSGLDRFVRARWAIGGTTPSFTFSVAGETT